LNIRRFLAGALVTLWAGFWGYFSLVSLISEPGDVLTRLKVAAFVAALLGSSLWAAWTRRRAGGIWLCVVGVGLGVANAVYFNNPPPTQLFLYVILALPPLLAGLMKCYPARPAGRADVVAARK